MTGRVPDLGEVLSSAIGQFSGPVTAGEVKPLLIEAVPIFSRTLPEVGSTQHVFRFANDYGASVVQGPYTYGGRDGMWELAVLRFDGPGDQDSHLTYDTPITGGDVLGWLSPADVAALLLRIAALS